MDKNLNTYNNKNVVHWYDKLSEITPVELAVFERNKNLISGANLLDIGIGGGRTTNYLIKRCLNYTGIDYSEGFVEVCKNKFKGANLLKMDARNLSVFANNYFDAVNFSFNGIDYVDFEGREKIFSEIARVLKPGGFFFFSTHNKSHSSFNKNPWSNAGNGFIIRLKTFIKLLPFLPAKLQNRKKEIFKADYAIINDAAHNYSLMTFYTTPEFLKTQLIKYGFGNISLLDKKGLAPQNENLDDWIFVTCNKI